MRDLKDVLTKVANESTHNHPFKDQLRARLLVEMNGGSRFRTPFLWASAAALAFFFITALMVADPDVAHRAHQLLGLAAEPNIRLNEIDSAPMAAQTSDDALLLAGWTESQVSLPSETYAVRRYRVADDKHVLVYAQTPIPQPNKVIY